MIIVKNTSKDAVLENINTEKTFLQGLGDTLASVKVSTDDVKNDIAMYIKQNAVLNGIAVNAQRSISQKHSLLETIAFAIKNALNLLDYIHDQFKKSNVKVYDTSTLTYKQKGMFDYVSSISFFSNYTSKILDIILTQSKSIKEVLTKADLEFINKTVNYYNILLKRLCGSDRDLKRSIDILSDEVFDEESASVITQVKGREAVTTNLLPHELNPGYWVRYALMLRDVSLIKSNRGKIDTYAMKLQKLENKRRQTEDPSLDRQIEYWTNEIQILDAEIAEKEAKYV